MPFFNLLFWSAFCVLVALSPRLAQAETKRVCHPDPKSGKEVCKNIKVHKKVEGTKVPEPTKKKK